MKFSKKEIGLLAGCLGVLLAVVSYSLIFIPFSDKANTLRSELNALREQEAQYMEMESNQTFYKEEIERLTEENNKLIAEFPAEIKPESEIMYVVELEQNVEIDIPSISYGTATPLLGGGEEAEEGEEAEVVQDGMQAYLLPMNISYTASYDNLKNAITYTNEHQNRMYIDTLSASYDASTGFVSGGMTFNLYYITGTDKVYEEPIVPEMGIGVNNIFGTVN